MSLFGNYLRSSGGGTTHVQVGHDYGETQVVISDLLETQLKTSGNMEEDVRGVGVTSD